MSSWHPLRLLIIAVYDYCQQVSGRIRSQVKLALALRQMKEFLVAKPKRLISSTEFLQRSRMLPIHRHVFISAVVEWSSPS